MEMTLLVNLTPHPIKIYAADTPDRIDVAEHAPLWVLPVADQPPARIGEIPLGTHQFNGCEGIPVEYVERSM